MMMDTDTARMLVNYNAWADQTFFESLATLPEDEIYRQRKTLFKSIIGTLNHNYQVDLIWKAHLLGEEHGFTNRRDLLHPKFEDLVMAQTEVNQWLVTWAQTQAPENFGEIVFFRFVSGKAAEMKKGAILLHLVNHKTYHRGWVAEMLFDIGAKAPDTDLSVYLCET